jgi:4-amino-4-deoxy-L-arabinose transferase-like glycosyltransferase
VALLAVAAAALRLHALGAKGFWMDESLSAAYMRLDFYNLARLLWRREANMTFYFVLLSGWVRFGDSVAWYRGLSVVFSVATVPVMYAIGKRLFGTMVGVISALLLTVNAYHVRYAQDARSYSLVVFLVTLATYFLVRAVETGKRSDWKWYVAFSALSMYSHFFGILIVAAHWASLQVLPNENGGSQTRRAFMRAAKQIGLWTLPVWVFITTTGLGVLSWMHRPGPRDLYVFLEQFAGNNGWRLLSLYLACIALAIFAAARVWRRYGRSTESWHYALALSWFAVPVLIALTATLVRPVFLPRYVMISLPGFILAAAAGLSSVKYRWTALPALALIVWFALGGVRSYYEKDFDLLRQDYPGVTEYVLQHATSGDAILFQPSYNRCGYQYYADHSKGANVQPMIVSPGHGDRMIWRDFMGTISQKTLDSINLDKGRVWVVVSSNSGPQGEDTVSQRIKTTLGQRHRLAESRSYDGINLYLYQP